MAKPKVSVSEVLMSVHFKDGEQVTWNISPTGEANVTGFASQPFVDEAVEVLRGLGLRPSGSFSSPNGIGWIEEENDLGKDE